MVGKGIEEKGRIMKTILLFSGLFIGVLIMIFLCIWADKRLRKRIGEKAWKAQQERIDRASSIYK